MIKRQKNPERVSLQAVRFLELTRKTCKWPLWPDFTVPELDDQLFCGAPPQEKSPYCAHHALRAKGNGHD